MEDYIGAKITKRLYTIIETKVVEMFKRNNVSSLPINPIDILQKEGHHVKKVKNLEFILKDDEEIVSEDNNIDAITLKNNRTGKYYIAYVETTDERVRFSLMHELGHIDMKHEHESDLAKQVANYYAAYACAPTPLMYKKEVDGPQQISEKFGISFEAAMRCFDRYVNWSIYGGPLKTYEKELMDMF